MNLVDALRQDDVITENGMPTNSTSLDAVLDLFFNIGAMRGQDKARLISQFSKAFNTDALRTMKVLFWARDVRGGAGERQIFKDIIVYLSANHASEIEANLSLIPEFGRWGDLLAFEGTILEHKAFMLIAEALGKYNSLCAKWMPRKGVISIKLRNFMDMTPKQYRKTLVSLTKVVETQMCAKEWEEIEFSKLPSVASARYQKAFWKNAPIGYENYVNALKVGKTTINAGAVYPYDIIKSLNRGDKDVAMAQWEALPDFLEGSNEMILPMVDTSGSMSCPADYSANLSCLDVAVSLGLYISERNKGPFQNTFLTFSSSPVLQHLNGNLYDRFQQMNGADWCMNTNIELAFKKVLNQAIKHEVTASNMPDKIIILSDMQFDKATSTRSRGSSIDVNEWNPTAQQLIEKLYNEAGYKIPKIIYWNLNSRHGDVPVAFDKMGTALVSGFSPAILKSLLGAGDFTPVSIMDKTIMNERYSRITI
jgi:hypothetical protein